MAKRESKFQKEVVKYLRDELGGVWWTNTPSPYTERGRPDVEGIYKGIFYAFELKKPNGIRDPLQEYEIERIVENGGVGMFADNIEAIKAVFIE